jgi:hypothetical protein
VGERERAAPRAGGSLLEHDDAVDEGGPEGGAGSRAPLEFTWWWRKGYLALDGDPPLRDAVEGHTDLVLRVGLRVDETERDRERAREDKDGPCLRVGIRSRPRGDKGGRFFSPSAWWVQNFRRLLVSIDVSSRYQK